MKVKSVLYFAFLLMWGMCAFISCKDEETYAEQKEKERKAIAAFMGREEILLRNHDGDTLLYMPKIKVITEEEFCAKDSTTDVAENEFVLFASTGVYMQIVRQGVGERIKEGETKRVLCRYYEYNILGDSVQTADNVLYWATNPEILDVSNTGGSISASFDTSVNGGGAMYQAYRSVKVPGAWILPLYYVRIGRQVTPEGGIAKVRLIVPHTQGHDDATSNVYPCFYEITYQEMRE